MVRKPYSVHRAPLWKTAKQSKGFDDVWFYHCDHLGTPQEMTDHTGSIIWKAEYKAWGECKAEKAKSSFFENSEIISNNIRFQGQYFDQETGLHYNRYRYYSPYVGRFVSRDPIKLLGGYNIYQYAHNSIRWVDPLGLAPKKECSTPKREPEIIKQAGSFEAARKEALQLIRPLVPGTRQDQIGNLGEGKGKKVGFFGISATKKEYVRYRLDYDPIKGPHINVDVGKGVCGKRYAIKFPGNEKTFITLLKRNT